MASIGCCYWWLLLGVLIGWLLSWLLSKLIGKAPVEPHQFVDGVDVSAARTAGYFISGPHSLEIIEGIGPAIAHLMRSNGVRTFSQLAASSHATLQGILDSGGDRFSLANPQTWAEQAALAAANRWVELRELQDRLIAGLRR